MSLSLSRSGEMDAWNRGHRKVVDEFDVSGVCWVVVEASLFTCVCVHVSINYIRIQMELADCLICAQCGYIGVQMALYFQRFGLRLNSLKSRTAQTHSTHPEHKRPRYRFSLGCCYWYLVAGTVHRWRYVWASSVCTFIGHKISHSALTAWMLERIPTEINLPLTGTL